MKEEDKAMTTSADPRKSEGPAAQGQNDKDAVLIYTTFPSLDDAKKAGRALVEDKLAACVNIFPPMTAIYVWENRLEEDTETAMIVKSMAKRAAEVLDEIKRLHPYSTPARLVLPVTGGGEDFLNWIAAQCGPGIQN